MNRDKLAPASDPQWYKDAILYEARVRSFRDSDGDGIGDFRGCTEKLDYLRDLGVTAIWLLPFYPSPGRDDGYDISSYLEIHPECGTLQDFKVFLREAHQRGLRVITELVINHTSDQHPWFQRARRSPAGSKWRDFYVWSDRPDKYASSRIIFGDFELSNWAWDAVAGAYYWHRFYSHQPDLNFENPLVTKELFKVLDFWLDLGVDGMRLDAIPYLFEREGTSCENLPETHEFLRRLRRHVDRNYADRMLLAEANQWPEDAVPYFGAGDECHMNFHFPIMPRLFMALHMEDRYPIIDILEQTPPIPETCQWALFLRNHDELTLEMVTDEERDYMYRAYAHDKQARINLGIRRRLAPLLGNDRRRIELMNALLFALPGTPIIYYGDEIGMGDNFFLGDRNGVRTPMQWSPDRNAGFSEANPQRLYLPIISDPEYNYESVNVESQQNNPHSLLWFMKRLIALRKNYKAFGRGSIAFLNPHNRKMLAFTRQYEEQTILVVANLSRFVQFVELDLAAYKGMAAFEMFGGTEFPQIGDLPYLLTLGPHAFYWFTLEESKRRAIQDVRLAVDAPLPRLQVRGTWDAVLRAEHVAALEAVLPDYVRARRWFGGKALSIRSAHIAERIDIAVGERKACLCFVEMRYDGADAETYLLPLAYRAEADTEDLRRDAPYTIVAELEVVTKNGSEAGLLYDALQDPAFCAALLIQIARGRRMRGTAGELHGSVTRAFSGISDTPDSSGPPRAMRGEQTNTSVRYGEDFVLKLYRRVHDGMNPEVEIGAFLTDQTVFANAAPLAGCLEYRRAKGGPITVAALQKFVPHEADAWSLTLDQIQLFLDHALTHPGPVPAAARDLIAATDTDPPDLAVQLMGFQMDNAQLLGQRTAEMHLALSSVPGNSDFSPEPFTPLARRSLYQSMRNLTAKVFQLAREKQLPEPAAVRIRDVVAMEKNVLAVFQRLLDHEIKATRIRCHGDFHLGQILFTGKDFVIIDFEGEPARSFSERRRKRSPLHDVAGMLRSYDYAVHAGMAARSARLDDPSRADEWGRYWFGWVATAFLGSYLKHAAGGSFLPPTREETAALLEILVLEKAVYELGYELNNRPEWAYLPAAAIEALLSGD
jgi:maltose alpha-D-glucosyltransferase/alpha-amylase